MASNWDSSAALTIKETVFCYNVIELGFEKLFNSVLLYLDNTSTLHVAGILTYSTRVKHIALSYFFVQELVEEGKIPIHYVNTQDKRSDLGTKHQGRSSP